MSADPANVRAEMVALKEPERRKRAAAAQRELERTFTPGWNERPSARWRAAAIAWFGTATARRIASDHWRVAHEVRRDPELADDVYAVLAARGPHFFETFARGLLREERSLGWPLVRRAVREGLIERPEDELGYVEGMVWGVAVDVYRPELDTAYSGLLADPELLAGDVWLLFEHDVAGTLASANTWAESGADVHGFPKWERGDNFWLHALVRLAAEGRLNRQRLLDASLDALVRDFRASTVGWYATLHEALEPATEEREARVDRYLALLTSSAPAVVKAGLAALKALDRVPADGLARAAPAVFAHRQKNLAVETLRLLDREAKGDGEARPGLLAAAAHALAHERADVQEQALKLLERHPEAAPRADLLAYLEAVSPTLRDRVAALTGVAAEPASVSAVDRFPEPRVPEPGPGEPLEPVRDLDELVELAAALLEGHGDGDDGERFLDGVARLCGERPPELERRTQGLVDRAGDPDTWSPAPSSGSELVALVVRAWAKGVRPTWSRRPPSLAVLLTERAQEVAVRALRRKPRALLACPTHRGGWLDEAAVAARDVATGGFLRRDTPDASDRAAARLRTVRHAGLGLRASLRADGRAARPAFATGPLPSALATPELKGSLAHLGRSAVEWWRDDVRWLADDALGARWLLTLVPAAPELQYARAFEAIVHFVDGSPYRHADVVLEHMLSPSAPMRDPAWDAVAAALLAKSPDLQRLATDVLVATVEDERYDAGRLGEALARLLDANVGAATRLAQPLRDAGRVSALHGAQVVRAVGALLIALEGKPHGLHAPLEAAVELAAASGHRLTGPERDALERLAGTVSPTAKLARLARSLAA